MQQTPIPDPLPLVLALRYKDPAHRRRVVEVDAPLALAVAAFEIGPVRAGGIGERVVVAVDELEPRELHHRRGLGRGMYDTVNLDRQTHLLVAMH